MTIKDVLIRSIRSASEYNLQIQVPPFCILWTDKDRLFEQIIPDLKEEMPELFILGEYDKTKRQGPALWLRCLLAGYASEGIDLPRDRKCVFYLPGIDKDKLRTVEQCPVVLKPLIELQYRGSFWTMQNGNDWTPYTFLKSQSGGLGLQVQKDQKTKEALLTCLPDILETDVSSFPESSLDAAFFYNLGIHDLHRQLLTFIDQGDYFQQTLSSRAWASFLQLCKKQFGLDPQTEGYLEAAKRLADHDEQPWKELWERYLETWGRYPHIPDRIRSCSMPALDLFVEPSLVEGWPQYNDEQEKELKRILETLAAKSPKVIREKLKTLNEIHCTRRFLLWAEMGQAPFAEILYSLNQLASQTEKHLNGSDISSLKQSYEEYGWKADAALLEVLNRTSKLIEAQEWLLKLARSLYLLWAEDGALKLQTLSLESGYPVSSFFMDQETKYAKGTCLLFIDAFRYDVGTMLIKQLEKDGCEFAITGGWAPFPTLTATGKPAISPVSQQIKGFEIDVEGYPAVKETRQSLRGGYHLKKLMEQEGWQILSNTSVGDPSGVAWTEIADIDTQGHSTTWKIASHIDPILQDIRARIDQLLKAGWKEVHLITDHGWLLVPGGLEKEELAYSLTENSYGRCAVIKEGALVDVETLPWYWNNDHVFAFAHGIKAFKHGEIFTHGGISLQESLVPYITIRPSDEHKAVQASIVDITWKKMRCFIEVSSVLPESLGDIRLQVNDPDSSVVFKKRNIKEDGFVSLVVEDDALVGRNAFIVLLDAEGNIITQTKTIIGEQDT